MRVLIYGAGALGSLLGALLSGPAEVHLLGRDPHMAAVAAGGLAVTGVSGRTVRLKTHTEHREAIACDPDLVVITVKAWDTAPAARELAEVWTEGGCVLSLQNGLGNLEDIAAEGRDGWTILGGTTSIGGFLQGPGEVVHGGEGTTYLGIWREPGAGVEDGASAARKALRSASDLFASAGLDVHTTPDTREEVWRKAIVNASINPLMAITGHRNGYLLKDRSLLDIARMACGEGVRVARACGLGLEEDAMRGRMEEVAERTAGNKCSMLQDVERGGRTEVDRINGELVRRGDEAGVPVPVNRTLLALVKGLEPATFR
jgi:2-dehydropantoate 2-reductase